MLLPIFLKIDVKSFEFSSLQFNDLIPVLQLSVFASTIFFVFFVMEVARIGIARSFVFINCIPVVTAIFAVLILGEHMNILTQLNQIVRLILCLLLINLGLKITGIPVTIAGLFMSQSENKLKPGL